MSWHKPHRTTSIYQAVLASLFGMASLSAYAMNLGQANIQSAQHEPLSATINVTNIDAANFHASVASRDIYRQMGLNPDDDISVTFNPTSKGAGQIVLTSNKPISTPFADIVLNLNHNGEQIIEPQTLLMPLPAGAFVLPDEKSTQVITADTKQNLPVVAPMSDEPMPIGDDINQNVITQTHTQHTSPAPTPTRAGTIVAKEDQVLSQLTPEGANQQVNILTQEIVRRVYPVGQVPPPTRPPLLLESTPVQAEAPSREPAKPASTATGQAVYVVQQGDSLWGIANAIARANDMKVNEVMNVIHETNPDAFNRGNADQLKANVSLNLPEYEVVLSQKAISDAINATRTTSKAVSAKNNRQANKSGNQTAKATAPKRSSNQVASKPAQRALPRAQMTLVTPTQQGTATGTNNKAVPNATTGGSGNLTGTLQSTRQQTANQARRVNELNQELSSAAKKVQLQNQRLAELQNRLKNLQEQNNQ